MTGETRDISRRQYIKGTLSTFVFDADEALGKFMITARIPTGVAEKVSTQTSHYGNHQMTSHYGNHQMPLTEGRTKGIRVFSLQVNPGSSVKWVRNSGICLI